MASAGFGFGGACLGGLGGPAGGLGVGLGWASARFGLGGGPRGHAEFVFSRAFGAKRSILSLTPSATNVQFFSLAPSAQNVQFFLWRLRRKKS